MKFNTKNSKENSNPHPIYHWPQNETSMGKKDIFFITNHTSIKSQSSKGLPKPPNCPAGLIIPFSIPTQELLIENAGSPLPTSKIYSIFRECVFKILDLILPVSCWFKISSLEALLHMTALQISEDSDHLHLEILLRVNISPTENIPDPSSQLHFPEASDFYH